MTRSLASPAPSASDTGRIELGPHPSLPLPPLRAALTQEPAQAIPAQAIPAQAMPAQAPAQAPPATPSRRRSRLSQPPGKRAPLWLAALIAGALLAAWPTIGGSTPVSVTAADYGLGGAGDAAANDGGLDADARQGISAAEAQARLGELAASRAAREPKTVLPTQGVLTTCYCMRWGVMHWGIDLAAPLGTPILAATDGVVLRAGPASGYGNAVYIQDAEGNVEIYGHMRYYNVSAGDLVHAGDQIAKVGSEGQSTGPHLHFEIHVGGMNGKTTDPQRWLAARGIGVG